MNNEALFRRKCAQLLMFHAAFGCMRRKEPCGVKRHTEMPSAFAGKMSLPRAPHEQRSSFRRKMRELRMFSGSRERKARSDPSPSFSLFSPIKRPSPSGNGLSSLSLTLHAGQVLTSSLSSLPSSALPPAPERHILPDAPAGQSRPSASGCGSSCCCRTRLSRYPP